MDPESLNEDERPTVCDRCFEFWGYKHPLCFLCLFIVAMFVMTIVISENYHKVNN